ncbi:PiggyBac transposable element-derived protein 4 [Elysia marginata]|uniref:PiggyBac transposable element-derived protein 4 n=1 Tax=Elysia marginata TaxID=1093978 RepID=A0AAV4FAB3_9GAST|nr:PiggyBac transposable element-derived protein 4 [Elysia marginata]
MSRTGKEVMHLMLPLLGKGYRLFIDNWYTSADLLETLHSHQTSCCGTLRANRSPLCLRQVRVEKGDTESCTSGVILAQKFVDKRDVYMISTCHPPGPSGGGLKPPVI